MNYYLQLKAWFEKATTREKIVVMVLSWLFIYFFFKLFFFSVITQQEVAIYKQMEDKNKELDTWKIKINALQQLAKSPEYKEWQEQHRLINQLQSQYKNIIHETPGKQWQNVIQTILNSQPNIVLEQIQSQAQSDFQPIKVSVKPDENTEARVATIEQQKLSMVVYTNYFDMLTYLQQLEKKLPMLYWDSLTYEVVQYPTAKVKMEFSILYEKNKV